MNFDVHLSMSAYTWNKPYWRWSCGARRGDWSAISACSYSTLEGAMRAARRFAKGAGIDFRWEWEHPK